MSKIEIKNIKLSYGDLAVLKGFDFKIEGSQIYAVMGSSGSGKTSLLNSLCLLEERFECDSYTINDQNVLALSKVDKRKFRLNNLGMIFQDYNLIEYYTVRDNLKLLLKFANINYDEESVLKILHELGIADYIDKVVALLSGGERQRVSIARMLLLKPSIIFADEPTGALDFDTSTKVFEILRTLVKQHNIPMVVVTHDVNIADKCDRVFEIKNGLISSL